jgi:uncharacterized repeat protein (TIGR03803 family)
MYKPNWSMKARGIFLLWAATAGALPAQTLSTLYNFCSQADCTGGNTPNAGLVQDANGNLFGATSSGGANNAGTVFSLSIGLGPFVETQATSGPAGGTVKILGTNLTGATRRHL